LEDPWIMLNADMAPAFPITTALPTTKGQQQVCGPRTLVNNSYGCRDPSATTPPTTWDLTLAYAADNGLFLRSFAAAYAKMTTVGYGLPAASDGATASGKLGTLTSIDISTCSTL
jgi:hypothetical protein